MVIFYRVKIDNESPTHTHFRLFVGEQWESLALAGSLCLRRHEFEDFLYRYTKNGSPLLDGEKPTEENPHKVTENEQ